MFVAERLQKIKEFLLEYQHADVSTLSAMLSVSEPTIRKDLEKLEESGVVRRIYGGAVLNTDNYTDVEPTEELYYIEKCNIAEYATRLVKEGHVVFLGHGFICTRIAKLLQESAGITIITNNVHILSEFGNNAKCDLLITGGRVEKSSSDTYIMREAAVDFFKNILISKAFFTVDGVSLKHGYTFQREYLKDFYSHIFNIANECAVVVESAKFGQTSLIPFMPLEQIPTVITNEDISDDYKKAFYDANVQLFTTLSSVALNQADILSRTD